MFEYPDVFRTLLKDVLKRDNDRTSMKLFKEENGTVPEVYLQTIFKDKLTPVQLGNMFSTRMKLIYDACYEEIGSVLTEPEVTIDLLPKNKLLLNFLEQGHSVSAKNHSTYFEQHSLAYLNTHRDALAEAWETLDRHPLLFTAKSLRLSFYSNKISSPAFLLPMQNLGTAIVCAEKYPTNLASTDRYKPQIINYGWLNYWEWYLQLEELEKNIFTHKSL